MFGNENEDAPEVIVHVQMGVEQAALVGTALGLLLTATNHDLALMGQDADENTVDDYMRLLGVKMDATTMFTSLWKMMGAPDEVVDAMLAATVFDGEG